MSVSNIASELPSYPAFSSSDEEVFVPAHSEEENSTSISNGVYASSAPRGWASADPRLVALAQLNRLAPEALAQIIQSNNDGDVVGFYAAISQALSALPSEGLNEPDAPPSDDEIGNNMEFFNIDYTSSDEDFSSDFDNKENAPMDEMNRF